MAAALCPDEDLSSNHNLEQDILRYAPNLYQCSSVTYTDSSHSSSHRSKSSVPTLTTNPRFDRNRQTGDKTCDWSSATSLSLRVGTAPSDSTNHYLVRGLVGNSSD